MVVRHGAAFHPGETRNASKSFIGSINYQRSNPGQICENELSRIYQGWRPPQIRSCIGGSQCSSLIPSKILWEVLNV
uniref:Uncharacterized protein n=1 Tax=Kalanchoe fedtschenkoi TaxID=63787 RepID=A0A7N1A5M8_KALFE